ncbi:MAG: thioredoxin-dependent thiol peroxidase [Oscillatoriales cyanobacterium SM2_2_1]|nr:thioredoxin-dependent thiol peroxidase [Oscillatoriales cyanobacterium SM2_2_1]
MLQVGDPAPDFTLLDHTGREVTLSALRGQPVVLYFYPRDNTPGCTKEACSFRDRYAQLQAANALLFGISTDTAQSHQKFITKYQLPFPLLCDPDAQVATLYESYGPKKFMGKEYVGIFRNTFLIDAEGILRRIYRQVKPEPHPEQVLRDMLSLQESLNATEEK